MTTTPPAQSPVMLYTEQTPNPESLKFVTNRMLYQGTADFREPDLAREWSPLAAALFELPYVRGVYVCNNFVTITKEFNYDWDDVMLKAKAFLKTWVQDGKEVVREGFAEAYERIEEERRAAYEYSGDDEAIVKKVEDLIDTYVRPAVEMDGGNITFKSFRDGIVTVVMQGACSGCPSSTVTLKSGIESMLQRMIPEVKEVVQEMG